MRHLILLRHAKAVAASPDGDFGRELAPRGRVAAALVGRWLARQPFAPDLMIASPARRTRETANIVGAALPGSLERRDERALYNADASDILAIARAAPASATRVLLVGHNPGMAELAHALAGRGDAAALARMARKFPTCACAVIAFDVRDWSAIAPLGGSLSAFITPQTLDASEIDD